MSKTFGAVDRVKRKTRKDKGKHRQFYNKKRVKPKVSRKGKLIPYESIRKKSDPLKCWIWLVRPMNKDSYNNWAKKLRPYARKIVYVPLIRIDLDSEYLATKENVEQMMLDLVGYEGTFLLKMFGHAKNTHHVTARKVATIKITNHPEGLKAKMIENNKLYRYYFWRGG